ncbi:MAG: flagellar filament capping protein FliD [Candidatus Accumulibacter sp.]|jgi:flagellar hook-associated protein 2|nr:flagellar filament capping protein FliD [Accumulibacter sp.]
MAISASGLISGLDVNSLITASMALDRLPLERAQKQLSSTESKISAVGQIKSAIAGLQEAAKNVSDSSKLYSYKASLGNADVGTVTASGKAVAGTYNLKVEQLATNHKLNTTGAIDLSQGGKLEIQVGDNGTAKEVNIASGASLADVAKAINDADAGVSATVVNGAQLVLTSKETGEANKIRIDSTIKGLGFDPDLNATDQAAAGNMTQTTAAQNAIVKIDGITLSSPSNTITNAVTGVDLSLKATTEKDKPTQLVVKNDTSELESRLNKFVEAYNKARSTMQELSKYDASGSAKHGVLNGDSTVRGAMDELRGLLSTVPAGVSEAFPSLVNLGVESSATGTLSLDTSKLQKAMQADFASVTKSVAAYGSAFEALASKMNGTNGLIANRLDGLNSTSSQLKDTITVQERRLATVQARYEKQFANLESLLSSLTSTGNYLTQQLSSLAKS